MNDWRSMKRGDIVSMGAKPIGAHDAEIAQQHCQRLAVMIGFTKPHMYAEIQFYGDAKDLSFLVHPESLVLIHKSPRS